MRLVIGGSKGFGGEFLCILVCVGISRLSWRILCGNMRDFGDRTAAIAAPVGAVKSDD